MHPAAFGNVIGVVSVSTQNYIKIRCEDVVAIAAPGESLVPTYPGDHYAVVSDTSFSGGLVSGAADVLLVKNST
jgi:subtilisin family serine protease